MVSIIIPSYNSENTIQKCLDSLLNQVYDDEFEIILVDSSTDNTSDIVRNKYPQIKYIFLPQKTDPGTARNLGIKQCTGDPVLFLDSDCVANKDWIRQMVELHDEYPDYLAIAGSVENGNDPKSIIAWASYIAEFRENIPQQDLRLIWHSPTCNISYKRKTFDEYGFFDSRLYPQEDLVYNYKLTNSGEKILFNPKISVKHTHRSSLKDFLTHQNKLGTITAQVLKIIQLPGSYLARHKIVFLLMGYFLPIMKFVKTLSVFFHKNRSLLYRYPTVMFYLFLGLINWYFGFFRGVFQRPINS